MLFGEVNDHSCVIILFLPWMDAVTVKVWHTVSSHVCNWSLKRRAISAFSFVLIFILFGKSISFASDSDQLYSCIDRVRLIADEGVPSLSKVYQDDNRAHPFEPFSILISRNTGTPSGKTPMCAKWDGNAEYHLVICQEPYKALIKINGNYETLYGNTSVMFSGFLVQDYLSIGDEKRAAFTLSQDIGGMIFLHLGECSKS